MIVTRRSAMLAQTSPAIMRGAAMANARSEANAMRALGNAEASARFQALVKKTGAKL